MVLTSFVLIQRRALDRSLGSELNNLTINYTIIKYTII